MYYMHLCIIYYVLCIYLILRKVRQKEIGYLWMYTVTMLYPKLHTNSGLKDLKILILTCKAKNTKKHERDLKTMI